VRPREGSQYRQFLVEYSWLCERALATGLHCSSLFPNRFLVLLVADEVIEGIRFVMPITAAQAGPSYSANAHLAERLRKQRRAS